MKKQRSRNKESFSIYDIINKIDYVVPYNGIVQFAAAHEIEYTS